MESIILVPAESCTAETEVKKSKFIAYCCYCETEKSAKSIINSLRENHKSASHIVYAFACGKPESQTLGASDDGEPKGTAGRPVLQVVKNCGITNILCAVIRYFGGTKLGTGGLVKTYTEAAKSAIAIVKTKQFLNETELVVTLGYENIDNVRRILFLENDCRIIAQDFSSNVTIKIGLPDTKIDSVKNKISEATSGRAVFF